MRQMYNQKYQKILTINKMAKKKENKFISLPLEEQERISKEISRLNVLKCLLLDTIDIYHIEERRLMKENDLVINSEAEIVASTDTEP